MAPCSLPRAKLSVNNEKRMDLVLAQKCEKGNFPPTCMQKYCWGHVTSTGIVITHAEGRKCSKSAGVEGSSPPPPKAGSTSVPFPLVRSGRTFFSIGSFAHILLHWLIWNKLLLGEEGKGKQRRVSQKQEEQNGVTKATFDRKDVC